MTLLRDVIDNESAKKLLGTYCYDTPSTVRLMTSDAPVHDGRESIHDIHVGVDNWHIDQDDLDAVLYDSPDDRMGGYMDLNGRFRASQNQKENDK